MHGRFSCENILWNLIRNVIKEGTCFKNPENPSCIDLILRNKPVSLKNTYVIGAGLSDFHKTIVARDENAFS